MKIKLKIPATTANLGPGFDTLGLALDIFNTIEMEELRSGLEILITGEGLGELPTNEKNLAYQAAHQVFQKAGSAPTGLRITQNNQIPLSRGLGSSAAAIVGGLLAANKLLGNLLTHQQLLDMATEMEGHPDNVTPAFHGGLVVACMHNETVKFAAIKPPKPLWVVVVIPQFHLSTRRARTILPECISMTNATFNSSRVALMVHAFQSGDYSLLQWACDDRLHQPYRAQLIPGLLQVIDAAKQGGSLGAALSGAGPTVIAFAVSQPDKVGAAMQECFKQHGVDSQVIITQINTTGTEQLECLG